MVGFAVPRSRKLHVADVHVGALGGLFEGPPAGEAQGARDLRERREPARDRRVLAGVAA